MPEHEMIAKYRSEVKPLSNMTYTSPKVTIERAGPSRSSQKPKNELCSSKKILDHPIRLYSTPSTSSGSKTSPISSSISIRETKDHPMTSTPYTSKRFPSLLGDRCNQSFADLDEALGVRFLEDGDKSKEVIALSDSDEEKVENVSMKAIASSKMEDKEDDIVILSESIISKHKSRINSLQLEQMSSPYVKSQWLQELNDSWNEREARRRKAIEEERVTQDVLKNESTIEEELRQKVRKQLTITDVIILEEPPPSMPEINDDMLKVIKNAVRVFDFSFSLQVEYQLSMIIKYDFLLQTRYGSENEVLATVFNMDITRGDIKTLAPMKWLNDNV